MAGSRLIMNANVLLTGGTGFFGRALLRHQTANKIITRYYVLTRNPVRFINNFPQLALQDHVVLIEGDIEKRETLPWGQKFSHIMHLATDSTAGPKLTPLQRLDQIASGTRNILDLAISSAASRFLFASSGGVYGDQPPTMLKINEDALTAPNPLFPQTVYSQAKRFAEHICMLYGEQYNIDIIIARCFSFVGPDLPLDAHFAVGNFILDAMRSDAIRIRGDGSDVRTYLDQRDLAKWLSDLLFFGSSGQAYNVGSDFPVTIKELAYLVRDILAPQKQVEILGLFQGSSQRQRYVPDISKISKELNLAPEYSLPDAIYNASRPHVIT